MTNPTKDPKADMPKKWPAPNPDTQEDATRPQISSTSQPQNGFIAVGVDIEGPKEIHISGTINGFDLAMTVLPRWGGFDVHRVEVTTAPDGFPVTGETLRGIPVSTIARDEGRKHLWYKDPDGGHVSSESMHGEPLPDYVRDAWPKGDLDLVSTHVALVYRLASAMGEPPTVAVANAMGVSRPTASRILLEARKRGALGVDEVGRAGGAPTKYERKAGPNA